MQKRTLCSLLPDVSVLGFGCMRFYREDGSLDMMSTEKKVDETLSSQLMDYAIERGVNYFDTAYIYLGGMGEAILGRHFKGSKRNRVMIATKLPVWKANEKSDFDTLLDEQLTRLQTDYIDCYLVHSLTGQSWKKALELGILDFLDQIKKSGKVRAIGFSFHDLYCEYEPILYSRQWDFCQIQLNYLDVEYQAGLKGVRKAKERGMGVIIMEPLLGGKLATQLPVVAKEIIDQATPKRTPAEWALRWVWNFPEVSMLLSGMNTIEQVRENCDIADNVLPSSMTEEELGVIDKVSAVFKERIKIHCAACAYCMPCSRGIAIPLVFSCFNEALRFDDPSSLIRYYRSLPPEIKADQCTGCGECEERCPHQIIIHEKMKEVAAYFQEAE